MVEQLVMPVAELHVLVPGAKHTPGVAPAPGDVLRPAHAAGLAEPAELEHARAGPAEPVAAADRGVPHSLWTGHIWMDPVHGLSSEGQTLRGLRAGAGGKRVHRTTCPAAACWGRRVALVPSALAALPVVGLGRPARATPKAAGTPTRLGELMWWCQRA